MGAWGTGHFDNDDALDLVAELEQEGLNAVQRALDDASGNEEYLQADLAAKLLAAAEVLAALIGKPSSELPEAVADWIAVHRKQPAQHLLMATRQSLDWIAEDSELTELWQESDEFAEWQQKLADLRARLG